jgi:hypothetical protein
LLKNPRAFRPGSVNITQTIQTLDPDRDHQQICHLLAGYEFPWDMTRALELPLLRTFCVPSIAKLLDRTGEFHHHGQKRYDDTYGINRVEAIAVGL